MKNIEFHYHHSFMSEEYKNLKLSPKQLTIFLREFGVQREQINSFFREFSSVQNNILFDGTDLYYMIYQLLAKCNLIGKYSPMDFIRFLKEIRKVKINGKWYLAEITNKTEKLLKKLNIPIT